MPEVVIAVASVRSRPVKGLSDLEMAAGRLDGLECLKRQLFETTLACQRCIVAIDDGILQKHAPSNDTQTQSYDALHIQQLQLKIADLEEQLNSARQESSQALSESHQTRIDQLIMQYKQKIQDIEDEKIRVVAENQRLRMEVSELQKKFQGAEELISALTGPREQVSSDQERIQMLEAQLQIFREDFESERRDRKTEQGKLVEMEQRVSFLTRQLQMTQRSASFSPQHLRPPTATDYHREHSAGSHTPLNVYAWPNTMRADAAEDRCDTDECNEEMKTPSDAAAEANDAERSIH